MEEQDDRVDPAEVGNAFLDMAGDLATLAIKVAVGTLVVLVVLFLVMRGFSA